MAEKIKIVIGLGTFQRPKMLKNALISFKGLQVEKNWDITLMVADNDPAGSMKEIAVQAFKFLSLKTVYLIEENRGIVYMRNRIIEEAIKLEADYLAFLDDDEEIEPEWLITMMNQLKEFKADVVVGRVDRILPANTPSWMIKGRFFERPNIPTGTVRKAASTSNVVFDLKLLGVDWGLRFHPALNLSGSSDTFLFSEATEMGAKIIWVNDNLIRESIPESRLTTRWILKRAFRHANCRALRKRLKYSYPRAFITEISFGLLHFLMGFLTLPFTLFMGKAYWVHSLRFINKGAGSFSGMTGFVYKEYSTTHGY